MTVNEVGSHVILKFYTEVRWYVSWIFISQLEVHYKDKTALNTKYDIYSTINHKYGSCWADKCRQSQREIALEIDTTELQKLNEEFALLWQNIQQRLRTECTLVRVCYDQK